MGIRSIVKSVLQSALRPLGVKLTRISQTKFGQIVKCLATTKTNIVFDVGANTGQFASELREAGYRGRIICFEPLPEAHAALSNSFAGDERTVIHPRIAIGDYCGATSINVAGNSVSSSLLDMLPSHETAAPDSAFVRKLETPIATLDSIFDSYVSRGDVVFIKIDTQGYESKVLEGAAALLPRTAGVLVELSLVPLYEGQHLWKELLTLLESKGFSLAKIMEGFTDPYSGRTLQFDGLFLHDPK